RGLDRALSGHGVGGEKNLGRMQQLFQRLHLLHELIVHVQAPRSIDDEHITAGVHSFATRFFGQPFYSGTVRVSADALVRATPDGGVRGYVTLVDLCLDRLSNDLQLLAGSGTINV